MLSLTVAGTVNAANINISNVWARDYLEYLHCVIILSFRYLIML